MELSMVLFFPLFWVSCNNSFGLEILHDISLYDLEAIWDIQLAFFILAWVWGNSIVDGKFIFELSFDLQILG
jgi:hypothetical protein